MDQGQVDTLQAQALQALAQAGKHPATAEVLGPHLGGDEQLITRHAAVGNGLADLGLVAVNLRRVDMPVAQLQTGTHRVDGDLILETEGAEAEGGNEFHEKLLIDRETPAAHRGATGIERFGTIDHAKVAEPCLAASGVEVAQYPRQTPA